MFAQVAPPSVVFQMPLLPPRPLTSGVATATNTLFGSVGLMTTFVIALRLKEEAPSTCQVLPASVDL